MSTEVSSPKEPVRWGFISKLKQEAVDFRRKTLNTLQMNLGKKCNQACQHCHVESSPQRTETMSLEVMEACLAFAKKADIQTVDLTGGAPELNPNFRYLVKAFSKMGVKIIDRCNLTILFEPGQETLDRFLQEHKVEVVASLPCYTEENVRKQRGSGVFDKSIRALQRFNELGYGEPNSGLVLNLVYNPLGAYLPPDQMKLEAQYKEKLKRDFGINFNQLFALTNMPVKRFSDYLHRSGEYDAYLSLLVQNFNSAAADSVMCYNLISVGWDGVVYDCDFNQMLELPLGAKPKASIFELEPKHLIRAPITAGSHCFGCTAGSGSSCTGALKN